MKKNAKVNAKRKPSNGGSIKDYIDGKIAGELIYQFEQDHINITTFNDGDDPEVAEALLSSLEEIASGKYHTVRMVITDKDYLRKLFPDE